jgi:hypothetical protein
VRAKTLVAKIFLRRVCDSVRDHASFVRTGPRSFGRKKTRR